jgi:hypothetical protein
MFSWRAFLFKLALDALRTHLHWSVKPYLQGPIAGEPRKEPNVKYRLMSFMALSQQEPIDIVVPSTGRGPLDVNGRRFGREEPVSPVRKRARGCSPARLETAAPKPGT